MHTIALNLSQWDDFRRDLSRMLTTDQQQVLAAGANRAGAKLDELVRSVLPPGKQSGSPPSPIHTEKQRRWWWATMHAKAQGKTRALPGWKAVYRRVEGRKVLVISGQYRRTGKLVQSLTWTVRSESGRVTVIYGTNRLYAPYVLGDPADPNEKLRQARIHQGNWPPLHTIAEQHTDEINAAFHDGAVQEMTRILGA